MVEVFKVTATVNLGLVMDAVLVPVGVLELALPEIQELFLGDSAVVILVQIVKALFLFLHGFWLGGRGLCREREADQADDGGCGSKQVFHGGVCSPLLCSPILRLVAIPG